MLDVVVGTELLDLVVVEPAQVGADEVIGALVDVVVDEHGVTLLVGGSRKRSQTVPVLKVRLRRQCSDVESPDVLDGRKFTHPVTRLVEVEVLVGRTVRDDVGADDPDNAILQLPDPAWKMKKREIYTSMDSRNTLKSRTLFA